MAADTQGYIYLTGTVLTNSLPATAGTAQPNYGGGMCQELEGGPTIPCTDAFVAKINAATGKVLWATYLGGDTNDGGTGIAVDAQGNVYVTGYTNGDFPVTSNAYLSNPGAGMFVTKISADGSTFLYSTHLPGAVPTMGTRMLIAPYNPAPVIAVDAQGNAYISGPTTPEIMFAVKLNPQGSALVYNTALAGVALSTAIMVDSGGNAYLTGMTQGGLLPVTPGAAQSKLAGIQNAFVEKLDPSGAPAMATYLGGSAFDQGTAISLDSAGNIYVAGPTISLDFPTTAGSYLPQAVFPSSAQAPGAFAAKLTPQGGLIFSSYVFDARFTYNGEIVPVLPDSSGGLYIANYATPGFAVTLSAPQPCLNGTGVAVTHLSAGGGLVDRTYFGTNTSGPLGLTAASDRSVELGALVWSISDQAITTVPALAQLNFGDGVTPPPACLSPFVLNAASFVATGPGVSDLNQPGYGMAPGSAITLTGFGMGPQTGMGAQPTAAGELPTQLGGVQVLVNGQPAPLLYVQSQQINAFAPFTLAPGTTATIAVTYKGVTVGTFPVLVLAGSGWGSLFRLNNSSTQAAAINQDGTLNGPAHPAPPGSVISVYGTGFGQTNLAGVSGTLFPATTSMFQMPVTVSIDGQLSAQIQYAGAAPLEWAGIDQINVQVPADASSGQTGITITSSPEGPPLTIWVK